MERAAAVAAAAGWCPLTPPVALRRPVILGALGTSLTFGVDLPDASTEAWPIVLQGMLAERLQRSDVFVINGAMRASSADFAALCFDELWGAAWRDKRGVARGPRLDLAIIEYNWSSSPSQVSALIEAMHARGVPCVGVLYYHPVNVARLGRVKNDPTPWKGIENAGHQRTFARVFEEHGVPFVNTSVLNVRHGHKAMLNTTRSIWSAAHLSPLGHAGIAQMLADSLVQNCSAAFRLPPSAPNAPRDYFCRIGSSLADLRATGGGGAEAAPPVPSGGSTSAAAGSGDGSGSSRTSVNEESSRSSLNEERVGRDGWQMLIPPDGRTAGLLTTSPNASLTLHLPPPAGGRFLSIGFECSYRHDGEATVRCGGACWCAPFGFQTHTRKKYTYMQRSKPTWIAPVLGGGASSTCELVVSTTRLSTGRVMLKAITVSSPRAGNRSVSTSSLYALAR